MMASDEEILNYVLIETSLSTFNSAITRYNLQSIYERKKRDLVATFFNGSVLDCSIKMRAIFNKFQTVGDEIQANDLNNQIIRIKASIKNYPKLHPSRGELIARHNEMVLQHNELCKGVQELRKLYRKARKQIANQ